MGEEGAPAAPCATSIRRSSAWRSRSAASTTTATSSPCNGRALPLQPTGRVGEYVAGVRYRAWQPPSALHPTIGVHAPLTFDIVDTWNRARSAAASTTSRTRAAATTTPSRSTPTRPRGCGIALWDAGCKSAQITRAQRHRISVRTFGPQPHNPRTETQPDRRLRSRGSCTRTGLVSARTFGPKEPGKMWSKPRATPRIHSL
jgi:hypothetical protein